MAHGRDKNLSKEAQSFLDRKSWSSYTRRAPCHSPSLQELKAQSFQTYVQGILFQKNQDEKQQGIAKVTLPQGACESLYKDTTARGAEWQAGTKLGDFMVEGPIKQCLSGIGGVYEYTLLDQKALSLDAFRTKADVFQEQQIGQVVNDKDYHSDKYCQDLADKFWKRLGPTMASSMYGADMEGSLFDSSHDCCGWNLRDLESCLQLLLTDGETLPGVTTPYLYFGMWASVFCAHTEDMNLLSINYLHAGAPKYWYAISPQDAKRFESLCESRFVHASRTCRDFLRHKRHLLSPTILKKAGVPFTTTIQHPGDAVITMPGAYHFGINLGFNVAEATNFAVPEWLPKGKEARVCMCRPHSVTIDMEHFENLLHKYEEHVAHAQTFGFPQALSYRQWTMVQQQQQASQNQLDDGNKKNLHLNHDTVLTTTEQVVEDQLKAKRKKMFVVEITRPTTCTTVANQVVDAAATTTTTPKRKKRKKEEVKEEWRRAVPADAKSLQVHAMVLVLLPGIVGEQQTEECFRGEITQVADGSVRVHFTGLSKGQDVWISRDSPKIFLDGGIQHYDTHGEPMD
jgi:jumonji domain-containing protein 2